MTAAIWLIDDKDKMEQTNRLDTDWGQGKFFDAPLVSFEDMDQGIKSTRNKWRLSIRTLR